MMTSRQTSIRAIHNRPCNSLGLPDPLRPSSQSHCLICNPILQSPGLQSSGRANDLCSPQFVPGIQACFPDHVFFPSTDNLADDTPNFNLSNVQGIPISLPPDQTPLRPHIPHIRMASDPPKMISPQHISSSSASRSSHRLTPTRSLPSYPEHTRPAHPQHDHSLSGDYGRSPARHYLSASSSPYKGQVQLPHPEQIHPRHQERSPYGPQVPPGPNTSPRGSISTSLQPDKFVQTVARYECPYCGKAFNRPSSLKTHTNTHTGEKRTLCSRDRAFMSLQGAPFSIRVPSPGVWSCIQRTE